MNHLAHLLLGHPERSLMAGGFAGDFIKGRLNGQFSEAFEQGVALHRAIDRFTDTHPIVQQSTRRFQPPLRRFAPIICDIAYDHFLAIQWNEYSSEAYETFCSDAYKVVLEHDEMPANAQRVMSAMQTRASLERYSDATWVSDSLSYLGQRIRRGNPLHQGYAAFETLKEELEQDFEAFMPELLAFAMVWRISAGRQTS